MSEEINVTYPRFLIVQLANYGPHLWTFETPQEVADFLWGKDLARIAIFKDAELVYLESANVNEVKKQLGG
jgi:hypothetical protein